MTDSQVIYIANKMASILDGIEPKVASVSDDAKARFNFLREMSNTLGESAAVYICARIDYQEWMKEEFEKRVTPAWIDTVKSWDTILDTTITSIKSRTDHPAEKDFAYLLSARALAQEIIEFKKKKDGISNQSSKD